MRVLTAEAMARADRRAIDELGFPALVLMENAALAVVEALERRFPAARSIAVLCGPGNNGGDGLAVARHLHTRGYRPAVLLAAAEEALSGDAPAQLAMARSAGVEVSVWDEEDELEQALASWLRWPAGCDLLVDGLFGTGLRRPLKGRLARLVETLGRVNAPVLAVDLPSGLDASAWQIPGAHLRADLTVTFGAPKMAHVLHPACQACGEVLVADLGLPPEASIDDSPLHLLTASDLAPLVPPRLAESHKGSFGHALVVAGGPGTSGAAILATRAAVRAGAGLVTAAVPEPLALVLTGASQESMTLALPVLESGALSGAALEPLRREVAKRTAVAIGPGLGRDESTAELVRALVSACPVPLVLDADGLHAFAGDAAALAESPTPRLLTPHPGELARLLDVEIAEIQADRLRFAGWAARETGSIVVLKGHQTLIAHPDGRIRLNPTGNPGMATGGSGDVLAGILVALLAQGFEPFEAGGLGVYLHGRAGDLAVRSVGEVALRAGDLIEHLGAAFRELAARTGGDAPGRLRGLR